MSKQKFVEYVKKYTESFYMSLPEGLTVEEFAHCLFKAHKGDFSHLEEDHNKIYQHWVNRNNEREFGYTEEYLDGKPAEKLATFGRMDNFNGSTEWYKEHIEGASMLMGDDAAVVGAESEG